MLHWQWLRRTFEHLHTMAITAQQQRQSLPGSPVIAALQAEVARPAADFTAADARWRDLAPPDAAIYEGRPDRSDLATVVIGFRSQPGLLSAVRSVLDQGTEIVVVNSGGGGVRADLAPVAGRIRRLLAMADKRATDLGIPGTEAVLTEEFTV